MKKYCCLLALMLLLQGCADMGISNPFDKQSTTTSINDVYFDEFQDVPIPVDMSVVADQSTISVTPDGTKVGLVTVKGRVDKLSLTTATIHSMGKHGWSLRGMVRGPRAMQLYEKDSRYAVCYFYEDVISQVIMEIWVVSTLAEGAVNLSNMSSGLIMTPSASSGGMSTDPGLNGGFESSPGSVPLQQ